MWYSVDPSSRYGSMNCVIIRLIYSYRLLLKNFCRCLLYRLCSNLLNWLCINMLNWLCINLLNWLYDLRFIILFYVWIFEWILDFRFVILLFCFLIFNRFFSLLYCLLDSSGWTTADIIYGKYITKTICQITKLSQHMFDMEKNFIRIIFVKHKVLLCIGTTVTCNIYM